MRDLLRVIRSKGGLPVLCESGGGASNTGSATIIAGPSGEKLRSLYVPGRAYSKGEHAFFVLRPGYVIVQAAHGRRFERARVLRVLSIGVEGDPDFIEWELVGEYENGDGNIPPEFEAAVKAALEKSNCYHCRDVHYRETD